MFAISRNWVRKYKELVGNGLHNSDDKESMLLKRVWILRKILMNIQQIEHFYKKFLKIYI